MEIKVSMQKIEKNNFGGRSLELEDFGGIED